MHFGPSADQMNQAFYDRYKEARRCKSHLWPNLDQKQFIHLLSPIVFTAGWRQRFGMNPDGQESEHFAARNKEYHWRNHGVAFADRGPMETDFYQHHAQL